MYDANIYLDARTPGWQRFEDLGAVWARGRQVYVAACCVDVIAVLPANPPVAGTLTVGDAVRALIAGPPRGGEAGRGFAPTPASPPPRGPRP